MVLNKNAYAFLFVVLIVMTGCDFFGPPKNAKRLLFIVPDGFQGAVRVIPNDESGVTPTRSNKVAVYAIPKSGILRTKGPSPFTEWHSANARYQSGKPVIIFDNGQLAGNTQTELPNTSYMIEFGMDEEEKSWMYVCPSMSECSSAIGTELIPGVRIKTDN